MCGFTGFLDEARDKDRRELKALVGTMTQTLRHRGPDDEGLWADPDSGAALGHRRLAVIDLSPQGRQPMASADGRYIMAYNGEVYNYLDLRARLDGPWRGTSDTEVILAAMVRWGVRGALERLNGMFAFALWDRRERVLHLGRDRLGEKPLYYGWMGKVFLFGSELKALKAHPAFKAGIDRGALALYMRHNYVPGPYSIYGGVRKLPPGTLLSLPAGRPGMAPEPRPYWSARRAAEEGAANPFKAPAAEMIERLDALLRDAVKMRMAADVPLGAFLSGGVDSSTIVAMMQAQSDRPVRTFSIGFSEERYNEAPHAKAAAEYLGTDHTELYVTPEQAMAVIPRLPALYDEPFADSSQIPTFLVSELARRHVTVSLSGDAGDELFGGYDRYFWGRRIWDKAGPLPWPLRRAAARILEAMPPALLGALLAPLKPWLPREITGRRPGEMALRIAGYLKERNPEGMYLGLISHWRPEDQAVPGATEPPTVHSDPALWARVGDFTARMMYFDLVGYLPDDILVKVDRASMGVSLESRTPLLDHRVVEFAWRTPLSLKIRNGRGKWLLRQVLYRYLPPEMVERPKKGFGVPIDHWLRGPLREWAQDLLAPERLQREGWFNAPLVTRRLREHLDGARDWHYHLWDVLMFQLWLDANQPMTATPEETGEPC